MKITFKRAQGSLDYSVYYEEDGSRWSCVITDAKIQDYKEAACRIYDPDASIVEKLAKDYLPTVLDKFRQDRLRKEDAKEWSIIV